MRAFIVILLLAAALSGCAEPGSEDSLSDADDVDMSEGNTTIDSGAAGLAVNFFGDAVNGTAPLLVNFTIEGNATNATWMIDFGDGNSTEGAGLPAAVEHTYQLVGELTALLTVVHGNDTLEASQSVTVLAGGPAPGEFLESTSWTESGTLLAGAQGCDLEEGVDWQNHEWDASALLGEAYQITDLVLTLTETSPTALDMDIDLFGPDGRNLGASHSFNPLDGPGEQVTVAGPLEAGTYTIKVANCSGVEAEYDLDIVADLVTP